MIFTYLIILLVCLLILGKSARIVISGVERISAITKIPYFFMGFFLVGVLTSIPEFTIGIVSAIKGIPTLSFGNLIGGSFVLLSLVTGLCAVFYRGMHFEKILSKKELMLPCIMILIPAILATDREISRLDGIIIILTYLLYLFSLRNYSLKRSSRSERKRSFFNKLLIITKSSFLIIFGAALLLVSSSLIVGTAENIVSKFNVAPITIGLIILAVGTNLPEISIVFRGRNINEKNIATGTILGSAAVNSLIIGIVSLISPMIISDFQSFLISFYFLIVSVIIFALFAKTKNLISPSEGVFLVILYVAFLINQIFISAIK